MKDKNINISNFEIRFKNLRHTFWAHTIQVQYRKNYFNFFLPQEAGASGNNIEKKLQKPDLKLKKKYVYYIFKNNFCSAYNPM